MSDGGYRTIHHAHHHFGWDNALEPVLRVGPGEVLELETVDSSGGQLTEGATAADVARLDFGKVNPVTGPVFVDGAEPGDALVVEVLDLAESGWGWSGIIPGFGLLAEDFTEPWLNVSRYDAGQVEFLPGVRLPPRPFPGTIGVALAAPGLHSVVPPPRRGLHGAVADRLALRRRAGGLPAGRQAAHAPVPRDHGRRARRAAAALRRAAARPGRKPGRQGPHEGRQALPAGGRARRAV